MSKKSILKDAIDVLERLERVDGSLAKEAILEQNQDNPALRALIKAASGPDRYFVRPSPNITSTSYYSPMDSWRAFRNLLHKLKDRKLTGMEARKEVRVFLGSCRPILTKWYCRVLNKDLRCGIGTATITKVFGQTFLLSDAAVGIDWRYNGCALAKNYDDVFKVGKRGKNPSFPLAVEVKYDGERANLICFPRDNKIFVFTRSGKRREKIEEVESFRKQVLDFCTSLNEGVNPQRPLFLDGEFLARSWNETSSIVRRTVNFNEEKFLREVRVILWDWAPLDSYVKGKFDVKWLKRKSELLRAAGAKRPSVLLKKFAHNVWVAGHTMVYDEQQLQDEYTVRLDANYEGVILKNPDASHVFKRTADLIKLKPEDSSTGRIISVEPGEGQHSATAPAIHKKVRQLMLQYGHVKENAQCLYCKTDESPELVAAVKELVGGDTERRLSKHSANIVCFRHGTRMGYLVIELENGDQIHVGSGFTHKAGKDQRSWFWQNRDKIIGMKIDFKQQKGDTAEATSRFPRFVRLREDV